jgi:hypothetical protein
MKKVMKATKNIIVVLQAEHVEEKHEKLEKLGKLGKLGKEKNHTKKET